jgi:hypothetical protein
MHQTELGHGPAGSTDSTGSTTYSSSDTSGGCCASAGSVNSAVITTGSEQKCGWNMGVCEVECIMDDPIGDDQGQVVHDRLDSTAAV